ncbi:hypothetical protein ACQKD9_26615 [Bacillus paramycoides]|uniref:hypothetical protein n=1 Tax=Bacillus paramycoides TaxID=2026194 RepID=UPI003D013F7F
MLLSACSSTNSNSSVVDDQSPTETVKKYHEAMIKKDISTFKKIGIHQGDGSSKTPSDEEIKKYMDEFSNEIEKLGGLEKIKFKEIEKEDIKENNIKSFDEKYNKNWSMVMVNYREFIDKLKPTEAKPGSGLVYYFLSKVDGEYYIVGDTGGSISDVVKEGRENKYVKLKKD